MKENLFDQIDIRPENINIPDGTVPFSDVEKYCQEYDEKIKLAGGLDLQLLGIGRSGHIGFNEPGSLKSTKTRLVDLDRSTRIDAARYFIPPITLCGLSNVLCLALGESHHDNAFGRENRRNSHGDGLVGYMLHTKEITKYTNY